MKRKQYFGCVWIVIAAVGCQASDEQDAAGVARAYIGSTGTIPEYAVCTHITATRLADFEVTTYQGTLAGGTFVVLPGEARVQATAYPQPCTPEPTRPPWLADEQITTFTSGANTLTLHFHEDTSVTIDPTFDDSAPAEAIVRPGSPVRTGRNGEDAAGPNYSLDGWEVKQIALPPAAPSETVLFSTQGKGGLPYSPRGLAALPDGRFVVQIAEPREPLRLFDATGAFVESWPVVYPGTAIQFDITDGLEAIDATHLVRTGYLNAPTGCDADGAHCIQAGLELLALATAIDGTRELRVTRQILMPELAGAPLNIEYPLAVAPVGDRFAVISIPNDGSPQRLTLLDAGGAVAAGPTAVTGSIEGLFDSGDGRLGALDYHGHLTMHDAADLSERPGEAAFYRTGIDASGPSSLAWDSATGSFLMLTTEHRLLFLSPTFQAATDIAIDLSVYRAPSGLDYRGDANQLMIADRVPPIDPVTQQRIPTVDFYDLATNARAGTVTLHDVALPARTISIAYVPARQQIVSHYRRPGGVPDATLDGVVYTHNLDGTLAGTFDLAAFGFRRIQAVNYLPATDELAVTVFDPSGAARLVVTSPTGRPKRSYRLDALGDQVEVAPITSGPAAGDLGAVMNQPSQAFQISLP